MITTLLRRPNRTTRRTALALALVGAACGGSASIQEQAADAVNAYIADDEHDERTTHHGTVTAHAGRLGLHHRRVRRAGRQLLGR